MDLEELLKPSPGEDPCGRDMSYDPKFLELDTLLAGTPETQFSAAEEPDWKALNSACLELLGESKDLRLCVPLTVSLIKLAGATGLRDGLKLLDEMLVRFWDTVFPKLDPDDDNDPLERMNIISSLSTPLGTFGDPLRFLERVRQMPLSNSPQMGRFGLATISGEPTRLPDGSEQVAPSAAEVAASFRDTKTEELEEAAAAIEAALASVEHIEAFLDDKVGSQNAPDLSLLSTTLKEIRKALAPYVASASAIEPGAEVSAEPSTAREEPRSGIRSRKDVVRALDEICAFYAMAEPSSPVPFVLQRAKRLAEMNFVDAIRELSPDALGPLQGILGTGMEPPSESE